RHAGDASAKPAKPAPAAADKCLRQCQQNLCQVAEGLRTSPLRAFDDLTLEILLLVGSRSAGCDPEPRFVVPEHGDLLQIDLRGVFTPPASSRKMNIYDDIHLDLRLTEESHGSRRSADLPLRGARGRRHTRRRKAPSCAIQRDHARAPARS